MFQKQKTLSTHNCSLNGLLHSPKFLRDRSAIGRNMSFVTPILQNLLGSWCGVIIFPYLLWDTYILLKWILSRKERTIFPNHSLSLGGPYFDCIFGWRYHLNCRNDRIFYIGNWRGIIMLFNTLSNRMDGIDL